MRVVALISGGKDSTYNMMQCVAAGHTIVGLANMLPQDKDELDSYMYQTVGHHGIDLYGEATGIPLYRGFTSGVAIEKDKDYKPTTQDEVEDLHTLLSVMKQDIDFDAVAVGAILSDYQRIRVENVCNRLGLATLAYLWNRDQTELLQEIIDSEVDAIVIKVAAIGLDPALHLGRRISKLQPNLLALRDKYGLNVCGEGGEYETFTLDCPLFRQKIVLDDTQSVDHSVNPVAPVCYLNLLKLHLEPKSNQYQDNDTLPATVKNSYDYVSNLNDSAFSDISDKELSETELETIEKLEQDNLDVEKKNGVNISTMSNTKSSCISLSKGDEISGEHTDIELKCADIQTSRSLNLFDCIKSETEKMPIEDTSCVFGNETGWYFIGGVVGYGEDAEVGMQDALDKLCNLVSTVGLQLQDICSVNLHVRDMDKFAQINKVYISKINFVNPPTRVCIQCPLPNNISIILDAVLHHPPAVPEGCDDKYESSLWESARSTLHVQSISHWAPANIGPYSQAVKVGDIIGTCGQIALVPGAMTLLEGGARAQATLALRHVARVLRAAAPSASYHIRSVLHGVCYVTSSAAVCDARRQLEQRTAGAIVDYVVVPALPRAAAVEWHVWAHSNNNRFDYEETGCAVDDYKVAIRRRWNSENTVAAIVSYVATGSSPSACQLSFPSEEAMLRHKSLAADMSKEEVVCFLEYTLQKLLGEIVDKHNVAVGLRMFYQVSIAPPVMLLIEALKEARAKFCPKLAFTVVPVLALQNAFTFISVCAMKH